MARKVSVRVLAEFDESGQLWPRSLVWEDGRKYVIDRVVNVSPGFSLKVGISGIRYQCIIQGRQISIFQDGNRWFMEGRDQWQG